MKPAEVKQEVCAVVLSDQFLVSNDNPLLLVLTRPNINIDHSPLPAYRRQKRSLSSGDLGSKN